MNKLSSFKLQPNTIMPTPSPKQQIALNSMSTMIFSWVATLPSMLHLPRILHLHLHTPQYIFLRSLIPTSQFCPLARILLYLEMRYFYHSNRLILQVWQGERIYVTPTRKTKIIITNRYVNHTVVSTISQIPSVACPKIFRIFDFSKFFIFWSSIH